MTLNTKIKKFDIALFEFINREIENGVPVSAVILSLDKCILQFKETEEKVIKEEDIINRRELELKSEEFDPAWDM